MTDDAHSDYAADDAILLNLVSIGDTGAYEVLRQRHGQAARRLARCLVGPGLADEVVAAAFAGVLDVTTRGGGPADAFRPYLLAVVRRVSDEAQRTRTPDRSRQLPGPGQPLTGLAIGGQGGSLLVRAFLSLPGRWIAVLWHTEIEQPSHAEIAQILGLTPDAAAALDLRALDGLRQAYLQLYLAEVARPECQPAARRLAAVAEGSASGSDQALVAEHLGRCGECRAAYAELAGVSARLRSLVPEAVLGSAARDYLDSADALAAPPGGEAVIAESGTTQAEVARPAAWREAAAGAAGAGPGNSVVLGRRRARQSRRVARPVLWASVVTAVVLAAVVTLALALSAPGSPSSSARHHQPGQAAGAPTGTAGRPAATPPAKTPGGGPASANQPASLPNGSLTRSPAPGKGRPPAVTAGGAGPSPGGAVASDTSTLTWNQMVSGNNTALLVGVAVGQNTDDSGSHASVTDNGTAMTALAKVHDDDQPDGYLEVFGLAGVPDGTNTIRVTVSAGSVQELTGGSVYFDGAAQAGAFGAPATAFGNSGTPAVTTGSTSGGIVAAFAACGSQIEGTASPASQEFIANDDNQSGAGNSAGAISAATGSNVTVSWSAGSDFWGAVAVKVNN